MQENISAPNTSTRENTLTQETLLFDEQEPNNQEHSIPIYSIQYTLELRYTYNLNLNSVWLFCRDDLRQGEVLDVHYERAGVLDYGVAEAALEIPIFGSEKLVK